MLTQIIKQLEIKETGDESKISSANKLQRAKTTIVPGINTIMRE
jgi:hypothetical protein